LAGLNDVTFDLGSFEAVIDRLLSRPMFRVQTCIDNKSPSAKLFPIELPQQQQF